MEWVETTGRTVEEVWRFATGDTVSASSPTVSGGVVYIGSSDGHLYAIDGDTGTEVWSFTAGPISASPAFSDGVVYVGSFDHNVYAVDTATGEERWRFGAEATVSSSPAVWEGVVYVGSQAGFLYALR